MGGYDLPFMTPSEQAQALRRADEQRRLPFWPRWMWSKWGAWLARHWKPAARLWRAEVLLAEHREIEAREAAAAGDAMIALQLWAEAEFPQPMTDALREEFIRAWCKWRTYHDRKCESAGCAPLGSAAWISQQQKDLAAIFGEPKH